MTELSDQKYLESLQDVVTQPGWVLLTEDFEKQIERIGAALTYPGITQEQMHQAQGRCQAYREIITLKMMVEQALYNKDKDDSV